MDLDQLTYFLKVAERRNFTRAAEDLGVSQPALSRSVARLEEELGQPVFERQTRLLVLTEAGRLLRSRAEQIVAIIQDTRAEITDDGQTGTLRIGAIPTIAPYYLPQLLKSFREQCPDAHMVVHEDTTDYLLKAVHDGVVDVAILALPVESRYLEVQQLFEEELLLVVSPEHPLAGKKQIRVSDIESLPFVLLSEAHCLSDNIVSFCRQKAFHPVSVERTSQLATVQELVSLGHGVSMVPAMARQMDQTDRRVYRSLSGPRPARTVAMVWNSYRFQSKLMARFRALLIANASVGHANS